MKKTLAIVAFVAAMLVAGKAQAQLSINLGYAPETITETVSNSGNVYYTNMTGFFAGATYNMDLYKGLSLAVGGQIRWNSNSGSNSDNIDLGPFHLGGSDSYYHSNQILVDIPVLLNYGYNINRNFRIGAFVGPTINFGIYGQTYGETTTEVLGATTTSAFTDDWYSHESVEAY